MDQDARPAAPEMAINQSVGEGDTSSPPNHRDLDNGRTNTEIEEPPAGISTAGETEKQSLDSRGGDRDFDRDPGDDRAEGGRVGSVSGSAIGAAAGEAVSPGATALETTQNAGGQAGGNAVLPSGGQLPMAAEKSRKRPQEGKSKTALPSTSKQSAALKRAKDGKSRNRNVLPFSALKRAKAAKKTEGQPENEWPKSVLPPTKSGVWWEVPADDHGFKIKLRWRVGEQKPVYTFRRLGKREVEKLKEMSDEQQREILSSRIFGECFDVQRRDLALRITPFVRGREIAGAENR
jgi:hypothetical protein